MSANGKVSLYYLMRTYGLDKRQARRLRRRLQPVKVYRQRGREMSAVVFMTERPQPHAGRPERYGEFYDDDAQEIAAWLNGADWARSPEEIEAANGSAEGWQTVAQEEEK